MRECLYIHNLTEKLNLILNFILKVNQATLIYQYVLSSLDISPLTEITDA